ncbi:MAG: hypothetical protein C0591_03200 [Marinilabiliales bacterium]|nr:MAG: hypothetical protein C0591_03200 [Marinilabiliales bacterium]
MNNISELLKQQQAINAAILNLVSQQQAPESCAITAGEELAQNAALVKARHSMGHKEWLAQHKAVMAERKKKHVRPVTAGPVAL